MQKLVITCLLLIISVGYLQSQTRILEELEGSVEEVTPKSIFDGDLNQSAKSFEALNPQRAFLEQAMAAPIDSSKYILGPGDRLLIKVWGILDNQFLSEVTPEGYLIIPTVAELPVAGKTLAEASREAKAILAKTFRNSNFSIRLAHVRKFRVFVVGEVETPGTYFLRSIDRVGEALQLANGLNSWGDDTRIQIRHADGGKKDVNLSEFFINGDLENNPLLRGGDIIFVPPIDPSGDYVIIEGNVGSQGIYQLQPEEHLLGFLSRVRAINRKSDIDNIIVIRENRRLSFSLLADSEKVQSEVLHSGDRIIVPTNRDQVYVKGEVAQPGNYPYLANYTARDYAGLAGILETARGLNALYVIRAADGKVEKGQDLIIFNGDIVVVPRRPRETFKDYLSILTPIVSLGISAIALIQASK